MRHSTSRRRGGPGPAARRTLVLAALAVPVGLAVEVRTAKSVAARLALTAAGADAEIPTNEEIAKKWDSMDEFLRIMFTMACKWKHGKDIHGAAAEKLKSTSGSVASDMDGIKADIQAKSMEQLKAACGMIVAKGQKGCRQSCADRWNEAMKERSECDDKCVSVYTKFEKRCMSKTEDLEQLYAMKRKMAESRNTCYKGYCKDNPAVWMRASEADMNTALTESCDASCTAEQIKKRCENSWAIEVDFHRAGVRSQCQSETGVSTCFDGKKADASTAHDTCVSGGKSTCDSQYADCQAKGQTDANFKEAEGFCAERKKMCAEQVDANCLKEHEAALEAGKGECEAQAAKDFETCEETKLKDLETTTVSDCEGKLGESCPSTCKGKCKVAEMWKCLEGLSGHEDPAEAFCNDFWTLLHDSSEVDPMTGNPIVLLAQ